MVDLRTTLISSYTSMKFLYYMQQPKQMIEHKVIQLLHKNPILLQQFQSMPEPVTRQIILKYWGKPNKEPVALFEDYMETEPNEIPLKMKNIFQIIDYNNEVAYDLMNLEVLVLVHSDLQRSFFFDLLVYHTDHKENHFYNCHNFSF